MRWPPRREEALAAAQRYDDLTLRCARPTSSAWASSAAWSRCASASPSCSWRSRPRAGRQQYLSS
jgi:hypothetical protein